MPNDGKGLKTSNDGWTSRYQQARGFKSLERILLIVALILAALSIISSLQAEVCIDTTTYIMNVDTSSYRLEVSTKTAKTDLLKKVYQAMEDRDRFRYLWLDAVNRDLELQDYIKDLNNQIQGMKSK